MIENGNEANNIGVGEQQAREDLQAGQLPDGAIAQATTAGEKMRLAREASGTHINTLAATLKVNVKVLEALENDQYEELPSIPFARALAASICRNLNINSQPVLDLLPSSQPQKLPEPKMQSPVVLNQGGSPWFGWLKKPVTWLVLLAILGGVLYWVLPYILEKTAPAPLQQIGDNVVEDLASELDLNVEGTQSVAVPAQGATLVPEGGGGTVTTSTPESSVASTPSGIGSALIAPATTGLEVSSVEPSSPLVSDLAVTNLQNAQSNASNNANQAAAAVATTVEESGVSVPADKALVLQATGESWVQVKNARGKVLHSTTLQAGDVLPVAGVKPYSVVIGKRENVKAYSWGKPYSFGIEGKQGAARFTLK